MESDFGCRLAVYGFQKVMEFSIYVHFFSVWIRNGGCVCQGFLFICGDSSVVWGFPFTHGLDPIYDFLYTESALHPCDKTHLFIVHNIFNFLHPID